MDNLESQFSKNMLSSIQVIAYEGMCHAAQGFSGMLGTHIQVTQPVVKLIDIKSLPSLLGGPECEAVGVYLRVTGAMEGHIMLILPYQQALDLVDLLCENPIGTTTELSSIDRSALAEVGNITGSFFLNSIADIAKITVIPSPPAVIVDMVGAIIDIIVASTGGVSEHILLLQAIFTAGNKKVDAYFYVIPEPATLQGILNSEVQ